MSLRIKARIGPHFLRRFSLVVNTDSNVKIKMDREIQGHTGELNQPRRSQKVLCGKDKVKAETKGMNKDH